MKFSIINSVNVTPPFDCEDAEFIRIEKRVTLYTDREIEQHELAYTVFKGAKYVNVISCTAIDESNFIYIIHVVNPSAEERFEEMAYGND